MTAVTATRAAAPVRAAGPTLWGAIRLVAGREIKVRLRDKTFIFSTVLFLVIIACSTILPALIAGGPSSVAVSQPATATALRNAGLDVRTVADDAAAEQLVRGGDVDAAVVSGGAGPAGVTVLADDDAPTDVVSALSASPEVRLLNPDAVDPVLAVLVPLAFGLIFFMTSTIFGMQIAQSVTEEKATRIVEILVATIPVRALLAGKIIACTILAMGQIVLIGAIAVLGLNVTGSAQILNLVAPAIGWFIPFFVVGFVLLASLWAVAGALVNRTEDLASTTMPVQMLVMLPFFAVSFLSSNELVLTVLSYVPFSAPMAMPIRLFLNQAAWWEPLLTLVVLVASAVLFVLLGARLYEGSLLRTNGRIKLATAWAHRNGG